MAETLKRPYLLGAILAIFSCASKREIKEAEFRMLADFEKRFADFSESERRVLEEELGWFRKNFLEKMNRALELDQNSQNSNLKAARLEVLDAVWKRIRLIEPVVKIEGDDHCGSGVIIWKREAEDGHKEYLTLTSFHVLSNILREELSETKKGAPFQVGLKRNGKDYIFQGSLAEKNEALDLGLIRFSAREDFSVASFASVEALRTVEVFEPIYAVGYPLCEGPIPTRGEISSVDVWLHGKRFYLITANAYFGNSGGGVFLADSNKLIGIFQKIYTHGQARPVAVTHMGFVAPLDVISDWLNSSGYGFVIEESESRPVSRQQR